MSAFFTLDAGPYFTRQYRLIKNQWYDSNKIVVHALGSIDDVTYTNSKEALENSYQEGRRFLECDFSMTADHQLVACHDWNFWYRWKDDVKDDGDKYVPNLKEFMATKVKGGFTALSGEELILFMKEHPDVYIITDTKDADPETLAEPFMALVALAEKNDCSDVLNHFIIQIYHTYMYEMIQAVHPFSNYIYTLYQEGYHGQEDRLEEFAEFCMLHNIDVITMPARFYSDELSGIANRYNLQIFVNTVNDEDEFKAFINNGVGVYTDLANFDFLEN